MIQQRIKKLIEMPDHTPENPSLNEAGIAKHNLIYAKGESPTAEDLKAEETRLLAEYASSQYQRDRRYPRWQEQMDMQYHDQIDGTTTWKDAIAKVKADNPKPE